MTDIAKVPRKKGGHAYQARPIIGGKRLSITASTKKEVERIVAEKKEQHRRLQLGLPEPERPLEVITYDQACERVLAQYPHRPQSKEALRMNLRRSRVKFGDVLVRDLLPESVGAWLPSVSESVTTRRVTLKAMRYVLSRAVAQNYARVNVASLVEMPKEPPYAARPFASWEEVRLVASAMTTDRNRAIVLLACATGLRPGELRALRWCDVEKQNKLLRVSQTVQNGVIREAEAKTNGSLRSVMLNDVALEALDLLPTPLDRKRLLFEGKRGKPIDFAAWRRGPWKKALDEAEVTPREPYACRDTFATLLLNAGAPIEWVAKQMGHTDPAVTLRHYARWQRTTDLRILDQINASTSETVHISTTSEIA